MCLGCVASSEFWDTAGEDQQLESPEEVRRRQLDMLREGLEGRQVRLDGEDRAVGKSTVVSAQE